MLNKNTPKYIAIEGVIGAGKTTLATRLAEKLDGRLVLERFEENPFLADFYKQPDKFAFQTQMFFLLNRYKQQQKFHQLNLFYEYVVSDYLFDKDRIFASLTLNEAEFRLYESLLSALSPNVQKPDLVVYLHSDMNRLVNNIRKRGRAMEGNITVDYIKKLSEAYSKYFFQYSASPLLIVNTHNLDFVKDKNLSDTLISEITRKTDNMLRIFNVSREGEVLIKE